MTTQTGHTLLVLILEEYPKEAEQLHFSKQIYTSLPLAYNILPLYFIYILLVEMVFLVF